MGHHFLSSWQVPGISTCGSHSIATITIKVRLLFPFHRDGNQGPRLHSPCAVEARFEPGGTDCKPRLFLLSLAVPFVEGIHRAYVQTQVDLTSPKWCDLGQVSFITGTSASSSVKWNDNSYLAVL